MVFLQCSLCKFKGKRKNAVDHFLKRHLPENDVPYFCVLCKFRAINKFKWEKHLSSFPKHISAVNSCHTMLSDKVYCIESDKKFELDISPNGQLIPIEYTSVQPSNIPFEENIEPVPEYSEEVVIVEMTEEDQTIFTLKEEISNLTDTLVKERNQFENYLNKMEETKKNLKSELNQTKAELHVQNQKNKENQTSEKEERRKDRKRSYQEPNKRIRITPCHSSPCSNGGECTPTGSSFVCSCPTGYFGSQCQGTPCHSSPCLNRGTCKPSGSSFVCSCPTGYSGKQCQITPCRSSPCSNGGKCTPTGSSFVCSCPTGYFGNQCQGTPCHSSPCSNRGHASLLVAVLFVPVELDTVENNVKVFRPPCPYGWKMNENKCYYFSSESTNWYSAKSYCQRRSSMLAEVTTRSKMRFLRTNAQVNGETFWLGGSDQAYEGLWRWTTSRQGFTVTDWHTRTIHEPNNRDGNEDCLNIHKKLDFEWNDDKCSNHYRFICEKSLI
ncbi:unnamed protein product [Mytilus edulis]|uniref:Uncharacterized protein n=1 Tax=Mytilus edulis TaxID=6550 RepID=A0A8S3RSB4_MYTED|nr:unnamed protein product [Mytilus edulis]